jgi:hypothetical protein
MNIVVLPQHVIDVILSNVHSHLSLLLTRNIDNNNNNDLLPLSLILRAGLEEFYKDVLLSDSFRQRVLPIASSLGCISTLKWAMVKKNWNCIRVYV